MVNLAHLRRSFGHAFHGLRLAAHENAFRAMLAVALGVLVLMGAFPLSPWQGIALILVMMVVLVLEVLNTVCERIADLVEPKVHQYVRELKDLMAAAVCIASLAALVIGLIIFMPHLRSALNT